jgi:hypothetical protein
MVMIGAGLAGGEGGLAAEPAAATGGTATNAVGTGAPPAGVRIAIDGNSWSVWGGLLLPLAKEVGIQGQVDVSKAGKQRLETGEVDVWTYGTHQPKDSYVAKIVEQGLKSNANFRFFYQAAWPIGDARWMNKGDEIKTKDDYDTTKIDYLQKYTDEIRKAREAFADGVNQPLGKRAVFIVPFGDAIVKLRALIVADKFPGVKRQSELFPDMMPHPGVLLASLSAYCHFAAIYRIPPPAGVPPPDSADQAAKDGYAQQAILRQIAWETVSEYPYAGIKDVPWPQGVAKPVAVATTTPAAPASAVPAELKGWQATTGLPDKAVITDYNDYIKELPQAERERVADVRYFTDGTGQNAVAITVNGKDGAWMSILVYDKQNKRLRVLKQAPHDAVAGCGAGGSIL